MRLKIFHNIVSGARLELCYLTLSEVEIGLTINFCILYIVYMCF